MASLEDWEVIFEPGAVVVVDNVHADGLAVELHVERYEFAEGIADVCASVEDVRALLLKIGASEAKADASAPRIWVEMQDALQRQKPPDPLPPHRLP